MSNQNENELFDEFKKEFLEEKSVDDKTTVQKDSAKNLVEEVEQEKPQQDQIQTKKEDNSDKDKEYEQLKKSLQDTKRWAHKKNSALINAKKQITEFLEKLDNDGILDQNEKIHLLKSFEDLAEDVSTNDEPNVSQSNPLLFLKESLDTEFNTYKKYNKSDENLDSYYKAFFADLLISADKDKIIHYLSTEKPDVALDFIIEEGRDSYETIYKGAEKAKGLKPYIKSLLEYEKKYNKLIKELDSTTERVYTKSIGSKVVSQPQNDDVAIETAWQHLFRS